MTKTSVVLTVLGTFVTALTITAANAVYLPLELIDRLIASGLSMVPLWVALGFVSIAMRRTRYRVAAFLIVNVLCVSVVVLHRSAMS